MIAVYEYLHWEKISGTKGLFNLLEKSITRISGWKLMADKSMLEIRYLLKERVLKHFGKKLLREMVDSLSPDVFRSRLHAFLEDVV